MMHYTFFIKKIQKTKKKKKMSRNVYSTDDLFAEEQTPLLTQNKSMPLDEMESGDGYGNNSMPCCFVFSI